MIQSDFFNHSGPNWDTLNVFKPFTTNEHLDKTEQTFDWDKLSSESIHAQMDYLVKSTSKAIKEKWTAETNQVLKPSTHK